MARSLVQSLEHQLAAEHRRVVSPWRAALLLRRELRDVPAEQRRWTRPPASNAEAVKLLLRLAQQGHLALLEQGVALYRVTSPFASQEPILEEEMLMELHPYAALSHYTALVFHGLTHDEPQDLYLTAPSESVQGELPIGTQEHDWQGIAFARGKLVDSLQGHALHWYRPSPQRFVGFRAYSPHGYPVRVASPERALVDGLERPGWCGGMRNVLRAWRTHRDLLNVQDLVALVDALDIGVLRQRVGFLLEALECTHPTLDAWTKRAQRGGSSRLSAQDPHAPAFNERWKLSLNTSLDPLHEEAA